MKPSVNLNVRPSFKSNIWIESSLYPKKLNESKQAFWFYDESLPKIILNPLIQEIPESQRFALSPGEAAKSFDMVQKMIAFLDSKDITKASKVFALGGGAISDAVGLVASIYMRGLMFEIIPTTLLSMVDASIGGKTAMNTFAKNRVGTFYPAHHVWIDLDFIDLMPKNLIEDGFSEIIKMAVTLDETFTNQLEQGSLSMKAIIQKAIELKAMIVEKDLNDLSVRKLLNFGHTFGHALEKIHQYTYSHGKCVASGMLLEINQKDVYQKVELLLNKYHCLIDIPFEKKDLLELIKKDKKRNQDSITWIQLDQIGKATLKEITLSAIEELINRL